MVTRAAWLRQLQEHPDRPQGRQHRQLDALLALADLLDAKTGTGQVSVLEVAKAAGVGERTARRVLAWAVETGVLQRSCRGRGRGSAKAAVSGWQLAVSTTPNLAANPESLAASSGRLAANSPKAPHAPAKRPKKASKAEIAEFRKWASRQDQPRCPHGQPGGHLIGPDEIPMCAKCRYGIPPDDPVTETSATSRRTT